LKLVAIAALLLGSKITDSGRLIKKIIQYFYLAFKVAQLNRQTSISLNAEVNLLDATSELYNQIRNDVIETEVTILHQLGYETQRITESPHKFMLVFLKTLKAEKDFVQVAWNFANDSYLGASCVHYPPEVVAAACIYLAYLTTEAPMPRVPWWTLAECAFEEIDSLARTIHLILENKKVSYKHSKKLLERFGKRADKEFHFYTSFDQMYKITDHQMSNRQTEVEDHKDREIGKETNWKGAKEKSYEPSRKKAHRSKSPDKRRERERDKKKDKSSQEKDKKKKNRRRRSNRSDSSEDDRYACAYIKRL
jgi:hypothetical protein